MAVIKINQINNENISKIENIDSSSISKVCKLDSNFSIVPIGLIIPFNDTNIPNGWDAFTNANSRMIIGAGDIYSIGDNGGTTTITVSGSTSSSGSHTGSGSVQYIGSGGEHYSSAGSHAHTLGNLSSYSPENQNYILIKSNSELSKLPVNAILFGGENLSSGMTNINVSNRYFRANSSLGETGNINLSGSLSSSGSHVHDGYYAQAGNYNPGYLALQTTISSGSHSGTYNSIINDNLKHLKLSAWTHASQEFSIISKMIGMYESLTPPKGWILCDGNNNTPDLRNHFVKIVTTGNESIISVGDNTVDVNVNEITHSQSHNHGSSFYDYGGIPNFTLSHLTYAWSHTHTANIISGLSYLPPYYALSFIMKQ